MRYFLFELSFNNLNEWFDEIDKHVSKDVIKILIGNKMDMETDKVVDYTAAEEYAKQNGTSSFRLTR